MEAVRPLLKTDARHVEQGWCRLCEKEGRPFGFYCFDFDEAPPELSRLFLEPSAIGSGMGRTLFQDAVTLCRERRVERFDLESDPDAAPFYLKMGCRVTGWLVSEIAPGRSLPLMTYELRGAGASPVLRAASVSERLELIELQRRASLANPADRDALVANPEAIDLPAKQIAAGDVIVAEIDGGAAGFCAINLRGDGDAELDGLFVEPDHWRAGLGRKLVAAAASRARSRGAKVLHVIGNPQAEVFYRKVGFVAADVERSEFGPRLKMALRLE